MLFLFGRFQQLEITVRDQVCGFHGRRHRTAPDNVDPVVRKFALIEFKFLCLCRVSDSVGRCNTSPVSAIVTTLQRCSASDSTGDLSNGQDK